MININPEILLPVFLYAETHYKFKAIYSRLFQREAELIADAPHRIEPGQPLPILLLVKDAQLFPIGLERVSIVMSNNQRTIRREYQFNLKIENTKFWWHIIEEQLPEDFVGELTVDVIFRVTVRHKPKVYHNDNYRISSHLPLKVFRSSQPLPKFSGWYFGDFHVHSNFTEDMVEFGAPLDATVRLAKSMGLNFFAVTDHSYDLDDCEDSWLDNDPDIHKWRRLLENVAILNRSYPDFVVLPGEEVSAGNCLGQNVHLLVINDPKFYEGKGDSAERWLRSRPDLSIHQILEQLDPDAYAIAAHPEMPVPFLQRLLIRRGKWRHKDFNHPLLQGFQVWNGEPDQTYASGSTLLPELLLSGKKISLIAGNDAHGNFNRFRQIGFPFWTFRESENQIFGKMRTAVKVEGTLNVKTIIDALKMNRTIVSNGPVIDMHILMASGEAVGIGADVKGKYQALVIQATCSEEFGALRRVEILCGNLDAAQEYLLMQWNRFENCYQFEKKVSLDLAHNRCYLRAEAIAENNSGQIHKCLTSPIWVGG
ncbi:MAG TPA: PHP domain-containing protein [bacterium]|nr:PHP domain-containing protein [bacterium]